MKSRKFSDEQIMILKEYYLEGDWETLFKYFPNQKTVNIRALARRYGIKQSKKEYLSHKDITGKKYGQLTVVCFDHKEKNIVYWKCRCACGKETVVPIYSLEKGITKSCGCLRHKPAVNAKDFTGQKFGMLTVIERLPRYKNGETYYRCICNCGKEKIAKSSSLTSGHTLSCGNHNHKRAEYWKIKHPLDDDKRTYSIYRHISPSGKSYIGITKQNVDRRFQNGNGYNTQPAFWRAIKKYGWENFKHEIVEENLTEKEASEREDYFIKEVFHSFAPNGYNVAEGGTTGKKRSKPIIQYYNGKAVNFFESIAEASDLLDIAQYTIKSHTSPETSIEGYYFEQMQPIHRYEIPNELLSLVDESHYGIRDLVARNLKKTTIKRNLQGSKPINKYDLDGHYICSFSSIAEAKKSINGSDGEAISAAVNPNRQGDTAYGFMWKYDSGNHFDIEPIKYKMKKSVLQIDIGTGEIIREYPSISSAARALKTGNNQIAEACRGEREYWKGYKWRFK